MIKEKMLELILLNYYLDLFLQAGEQSQSIDLEKMLNRNIELQNEFLKPYMINLNLERGLPILWFIDLYCLILTVNLLKNLNLDLEEEISILSKYNTTPNELTLIKTLLLLQDEDNPELFKSYIEVLSKSGIKLRDVLLCLQDKGIILKSWKIPNEGSPFDPYAIPFNKSFLKTLYKCSFEMGKELFENYPQFGSVQGNVVGLRSVSKKFDTLEDAYFKYGKAIGWSPERHSRIIELVNWAKEHNIINYTLKLQAHYVEIHIENPFNFRKHISF